MIGYFVLRLKYGSGLGLGKRGKRGMISLSTPVVMGALPKEAIQKVINAWRAESPKHVG